MSVARRFALAAVLVVPAVCAAGAEVPVVFWASDPVRPGEMVVVQGGRWGKQPKVEVSRLAQRIKGFDASVIALEEIDQISALDDLRSRMGGSWQVYTGSVLGQPQQNALLYDASKVDLIK